MADTEARSPLLREIDEIFWAGYLTHLFRMGAVTADTPPAEIWQMKAEFMAGLRGEEPT